MKLFLALCILMIGLVVMPPGPVQATSIDNGFTFVADVGQSAPVAMIQEIGGVDVIQYSNQIAQDCVLQESVVPDELRSTALNPPKSIEIKSVYAKHIQKFNHPPLLTKRMKNNKVSVERIRIRDDTSI